MPHDAEFLVRRLEEAGATLLALRVRGCRPAGIGSSWPSVVRDAAESYGYTEADAPPAVPSARRITEMDEALGWLALIPLAAPPWQRHGGAQLRRVVGLRMLVSPRTERHVHSWRRVATILRTNTGSAQRWHDEAIRMIRRAVKA